MHNGTGRMRTLVVGGGRRKPGRLRARIRSRSVRCAVGGALLQRVPAADRRGGASAGHVCRRIALGPRRAGHGRLRRASGCGPIRLRASCALDCHAAGAGHSRCHRGATGFDGADLPRTGRACECLRRSAPRTWCGPPRPGRIATRSRPRGDRCGPRHDEGGCGLRSARPEVPDRADRRHLRGAG